MKHGKKYVDSAKLIDRNNLYDVAEALETALITYQRYEAGERDPNAPMIVAMADFYGVSADYLLGRRDERL